MICKKGEEIDFLGVFLHGSAFVSIDHAKIKTLGIGEMVGFMYLSEFITSKEGA